MKALEIQEAVAASQISQSQRHAEANFLHDLVAAADYERLELLHHRWTILSSQGKWAECVDLARNLIADGIDVSCGWLYLAEATKNAEGGTLHMAYDILVSATQTVQAPIIFFALAHYALELGKFVEARRWLAYATLERAR